MKISPPWQLHSTFYENLHYKLFSLLSLFSINDQTWHKRFLSTWNLKGPIICWILITKVVFDWSLYLLCLKLSKNQILCIRVVHVKNRTHNIILFQVVKPNFLLYSGSESFEIKPNFWLVELIGWLDLGVAIGAGWQALIAYINIGCYYIFGLPPGIILGFKLGLGAMVINLF